MQHRGIHTLEMTFCQKTINRIGGAMVSVLASDAVDRGFRSLIGSN